MADTAAGVSVPPPVTAAQRSVLYAVRRRGEATVVDVAEMLDMTPSRRPPAPQRPRRCRAAGGRRGGPRRRPAGAQRADVLHHDRRPRPLFPRAYGELTNQLLALRAPGAVTAPFEHRRDDRIAGARARLARQAQLQGQGHRAGPHPRRGRLPGRRRADRPRCRTASPSATAPSSPSLASTPRPARPSSSSCAPPCPEADIERVTHMMAGSHSCSYEVRKKRAAA